MNASQEYIAQPEAGVLSFNAVWILCGAALYLYLVMFIPPGTPIVFGGDQMIYLLNATRMIDGKVMYRDFFQFTTPGTEVVYFCLFNMLGPHAWVPRAALIVIGACLTWLTVYLSRKVIGGVTAFVPGILFLIFPLRRDLDGTHHWYSVLAVLAAVAVVIEKRTMRRLAVGGALCGLATWFTQARGILTVLAIATFLVWERRELNQNRRSLWKEVGCVVGTFAASVVATNAYFVWKAGWERFLYCTVTFGLRYYPADAKWNSLQIYMAEPPAVPDWTQLPALATWLFIHALLPMTYVVFIFRYRRARSGQSQEPWDRLMLLTIVGLFLFVGALPAPAYSRLCPIAIPALILLVWLMRSARGITRVVVTAAAGCTILALGILEPLARQHRTYLYLNTPSGRIAYSEPTPLYEKHRWLMSRTRPSEYFFEGLWAQMYFPLGLKNPARVPYVTSTDYTRPEEVLQVVDGLERHRVRTILWPLDLDLTPSIPSEGDHLQPLRDYLRRHSRAVKTFADGDQAWERIESPGAR